MKKINLLAIFAIFTLSATTVMAHQQFNIEEFNTDTVKETQPQLQKIIEQELNTYKQSKDELPDYQSLNQQMINMIQEAINENKGTEYSRFLEDYKEFLSEVYHPRNFNLSDLIKKLDFGTQYISNDDRTKYVNFLCNQDRYLLKSKDSIVNMAFLTKKELAYDQDYRFDLIRCLKKQEPVRIKLHTFRNKISNFLHNPKIKEFFNSPEIKEVGQGFQAIENSGSY